MSIPEVNHTKTVSNHIIEVFKVRESNLLLSVGLFLASVVPLLALFLAGWRVARPVSRAACNRSQSIARASLAHYNTPNSHPDRCPEF